VFVPIEADIADALYDVRDNWETRLLTRFFSSTEIAIGGAGCDVLFVHGSSGNVDMTLPPYGSQTFDTSHDHFDRKATDEQADALNAGAMHLWEHGIFGLYDTIVPFADYDTDLQAEDCVVYDGDNYRVVTLWDDHDLRTARRAIIAKVM